jgi:hypothetical protein
MREVSTFSKFVPLLHLGFGVNNLLFNPHYFHGDVKGGTCEEWTVVNTFHPFHTHFVPFYITSENGIDLDETDRFWRDTYPGDRNFTATVCFPARDVESYLNVHCHMPHHQDAGMAAFYRLLPSDPEEEVDVEADEVDTSSSNRRASTALLIIITSISAVVLL